MKIWIENLILQRWLDLHFKLRVPGHLGALHHTALGDRRQERQDVLPSRISGELERTVLPTYSVEMSQTNGPFSLSSFVIFIFELITTQHIPSQNKL